MSVEFLEYENILVDRLVDKASSTDEPRSVGDFPSDRWLLSSHLQKSIRRGLVEKAVTAALHLKAIDSAYCWRRLRIVAFEDIGIANLDLLATTLSVAGKRRTHRILGEDRLLAYLVAEMAGSVKSRTTCDILCLAEFSQVPVEERHALVRASKKMWLETATDDAEPVWRRALAFNLIGGLTRRTPRGFETLSRYDGPVMEEALERLEVSKSVRYSTQMGRNTEGLNTSLPLCAVLLKHSHMHVTHDKRYPGSETTIGSAIAAAYCMYTRVGNQAFTHLLRRDIVFQREFIRAGARVPAKALGYLTFHMEGSLLDQRLDSSEARTLQEATERAELASLAIKDEAVATLRAMLMERMPALNVARREVYRMTEAQATLPGFQ